MTGAASSWLVNLIVPGGGLVLAGRIATGVAMGVGFALLANLALAATWIVPAEFPDWLRRAAWLGVAVAYLSSQALLAQVLRSERERALAAWRRRVLLQAQGLLESGSAREAVAVLARLPEAQRDLLWHVRRAQALAQAGERVAAAAAWRRVRELDRHRVYGEPCRAALAALDGAGSAGAQQSPGAPAGLHRESGR